MYKLKIILLTIFISLNLVQVSLASSHKEQRPKDFAFWLLDKDEDFNHHLRVRVIYNSPYGDDEDGLPIDTNLIFTYGLWDQALLSQTKMLTRQGATLPLIERGETLDLLVHQFPVNATLILTLVDSEGRAVPTYYGNQSFTYGPRKHYTYSCGDCSHSIMKKIESIRISISRDY